MCEIYDESGMLVGWRHTEKEAICRLCKISIYSMDCFHSDPELIEWKHKKDEDILVIRTKKLTYIDIPDEKLKPGMKVHVKGWNKGCVFVYQKTEGGRHVLKTPKTQKIYLTTNRLQYIRANEPAHDLAKWKGICRFHGTSNKYCCGNWTEIKKVETV